MGNYKLKNMYPIKLLSIALVFFTQYAYSQPLQEITIDGIGKATFEDIEISIYVHGPISNLRIRQSQDTSTIIDPFLFDHFNGKPISKGDTIVYTSAVICANSNTEYSRDLNPLYYNQQIDSTHDGKNVFWAKFNLHNYYDINCWQINSYPVNDFLFDTIYFAAFFYENIVTQKATTRRIKHVTPLFKSIRRRTKSVLIQKTLASMELTNFLLTTNSVTLSAVANIPPCTDFKIRCEIITDSKKIPGYGWDFNNDTVTFPLESGSHCTLSYYILTSKEKILCMDKKFKVHGDRDSIYHPNFNSLLDSMFKGLNAGIKSFIYDLNIILSAGSYEISDSIFIPEHFKLDSIKLSRAESEVSKDVKNIKAFKRKANRKTRRLNRTLQNLVYYASFKGDTLKPLIRYITNIDTLLGYLPIENFTAVDLVYYNNLVTGIRRRVKTYTNNGFHFSKSVSQYIFFKQFRLLLKFVEKYSPKNQSNGGFMHHKVFNANKSADSENFDSENYLLVLSVTNKYGTEMPGHKVYWCDEGNRVEYSKYANNFEILSTPTYKFLGEWEYFVWTDYNGRNCSTTINLSNASIAITFENEHTVLLSNELVNKILTKTDKAYFFKKLEEIKSRYKVYYYSSVILNCE